MKKEGFTYAFETEVCIGTRQLCSIGANATIKIPIFVVATNSKVTDISVPRAFINI